MLSEKFQKKFLSFKLPTILRDMMKSHSALLHPAQDTNHPFVQGQCIQHLPFGRFVTLS
jgi:hypothetical protein